MKYIIDIDYKKCINCFACYLINRDIFGIKENKIYLKKKIIEDENEINDLIEAAKACPANAIYYQIVEED
ncbi:MAG: ferredoxin [Nanopusillaceae archaeon]|jgi:ferredoxin